MLSRITATLPRNRLANGRNAHKTTKANISGVSQRSNAHVRGENALRKLAGVSKSCGAAHVHSTGPRRLTEVALRAYSSDPGKSWNTLPPGYEEGLSKLKGGRKEPEGELGVGDGVFRKGFGGGMGWGGFLLFCAVGGAIWWWGRKRRMEIEDMRKRVTTVGDAKIGGNWSLVDHAGRPMTSANFWGKYPLIYFGFTYCPDICPMELKKMAKAIDLLPPEAQNLIVPMMFSVDPWRDSLAHLAGYVGEFHPKLLGLVGTPQQIDEVTRKFRVYTSKGPEETEGDYLMDHSIFMYFMDKEGKFVDYYGVAMEPEEIADSILKHMIVRGDLPEPGVLGELKWWWKNRSPKTNVN